MHSQNLDAPETLYMSMSNALSITRYKILRKSCQISEGDQTELHK